MPKNMADMLFEELTMQVQDYDVLRNRLCALLLEKDETKKRIGFLSAMTDSGLFKTEEQPRQRGEIPTFGATR